MNCLCTSFEAISKSLKKVFAAFRTAIVVAVGIRKLYMYLQEMRSDQLYFFQDRAVLTDFPNRK